MHTRKAYATLEAWRGEDQPDAREGQAGHLGCMTATMLMSEPLFEVDLPPEQRIARAQQFSLLLEQMMSAKFILDAVPTATDDASLPWLDNIYFESWMPVPLSACFI
jgi:hypothetical protein